MMQKEKLRTGFTTGTCAQAASKAASIMLFTKNLVKSVEVETPKGVKLNVKIIDQKIGRDFAKCGVIKDAGDDPDVTNGARICARVQYSKKKGIYLKGGKGVGIVTKPGLAVPVGEYAINPTPREMIIKEVTNIMRNVECRMQNVSECGIRNAEYGVKNFTICNPQSAFKKGIEVIISVPSGREIAKHTFNPRLGIVGGISIIGTTGIVEPRSTDAYKTSLSLELDVLKAAGYKKATLVLGYVGERFCRETLKLNPDSIVKIGDHIGFMLSRCAKKKIRKVLLIGHIGKLVKVANKQFDTNIKFGDNRIKTIMRYAKVCGAKKEIIEEISRQVSAEATIDILTKHNLRLVFDMIAKKTVDAINVFVKPAPSKKKLHGRKRGRVNNKLSVGCILLSLQGEVLSAYPKKVYRHG